MLMKSPLKQYLVAVFCFRSLAKWKDGYKMQKISYYLTSRKGKLTFCNKIAIYVYEEVAEWNNVCSCVLNVQLLYFQILECDFLQIVLILKTISLIKSIIT